MSKLVIATSPNGLIVNGMHTGFSQIEVSASITTLAYSGLQNNQTKVTKNVPGQQKTQAQPKDQASEQGTDLHSQQQAGRQMSRSEKRAADFRAKKEANAVAAASEQKPNDAAASTPKQVDPEPTQERKSSVSGDLVPPVIPLPFSPAIKASETKKQEDDKEAADALKEAIGVKKPAISTPTRSKADKLMDNCEGMTLAQAEQYLKANGDGIGQATMAWEQDQARA